MSGAADPRRWEIKYFASLITHIAFFVLNNLLLNLIRLYLLDIVFVSFFSRLKIVWYPGVSHCAY